MNGALTIGTLDGANVEIREEVAPGKFSSDRSIADYCRKIWRVKPFPVELKLQRLPEDGIKFSKRNEIVRT